jgi:hypothetical protein
MGDGLVLYPHFGPQVVRGWLDKLWRHRHRASPMLDNVVVLAPNPLWVKSLPNGKLPDRRDFKVYRDDDSGRMYVWRKAIAHSRQLVDDFVRLVDSGRPIDALPLV